MWLIHRPDRLHSYISSLKDNGLRITLVPTMGALHAGHLSLIRAAKGSGDRCICSIFVNPTQFTNAEDLLKYPRTLASDLAMLEAEGVDTVFLPESKELYQNEKPLDLDFGDLVKHFEGASRPGHFEGVARVVRIFFELIQPDMAFFGWKDFQQCAVIASLVRQLNLPLELSFQPTLREADGLAMSSRNSRLSPEQRAAAPVIYQALSMAAGQIDRLPVSEIRRNAIDLIESTGLLTVDYFDLADARELRPLSSRSAARYPVWLTAVYAGTVRLIDNLPTFDMSTSPWNYKDAY